MKKRYKIAVFFVCVCMLTMSIGMSVFAASGSVNVSSAAGNVGDTVTINASVSSANGAIGAASVVLNYDPSALEFVGGSGETNGGGGSVSYASAGDGSASSLGFSMTFRILKAGTHGISGSAEAYNWDEELLSMSMGAGSVTGSAPAPAPAPKPTPSPEPSQKPKPETKPTEKPQIDKDKNKDKNKGKEKDKDKDKDKDKKSNNAKLSAMRVQPGQIEPAFSAEQTSYKVMVPKDTKEVSITATAQDSKATVSISGEKNLKPGANTATVVVTAENGEKQTYELMIQCGEEQDAEIKINGKVYQLSDEFKDEEIPVGFERAKKVIRNQESAVMIREQGNLIVVCLSDDENHKGFYLYDETKDEFYPFLQIKVSDGKYIIPVPLDEKINLSKEYKKVTFKLQDKDIQAWQGKNKDFYIICVINDEGSIGYYRYDAKDHTYQRYIVEDSKTDSKAKNDNDKKITILGNLRMNPEYCGPTILGLSLLSLVLLITVICTLIDRYRNK